MAGTGLLGSFPLTRESITENVIERDGQWMIGVFLLGHVKKTDNKRRFIVQAVGRSDSDMAAALMDLVDRYDSFKFHTYASTRRAFEKECRLYHKFKPADTQEHPQPPENTKFVCPDARCPLGE